MRDQFYCGTDLAYYLLAYSTNEKHVALLGLLRICKYSSDGISGQVGSAQDPDWLE